MLFYYRMVDVIVIAVLLLGIYARTRTFLFPKKKKSERMVKRIMEEIKKAIQEGVTSHPEVGIVGRRMTSTDKAVMLLVLVLGARQNLRNDDNIIITTDDVRGYCPLSTVDDCVCNLIEHRGYVNYCWYDLITYYYPTDSAI